MTADELVTILGLGLIAFMVLVLLVIFLVLVGSLIKKYFFDPYPRSFPMTTSHSLSPAECCSLMALDPTAKDVAHEAAAAGIDWATIINVLITQGIPALLALIASLKKPATP